MRLRLLALALPLMIVAAHAAAAPAVQQQYIVKTKHLSAPPKAKPAPSLQDVVRAAGGHVDYEWRERLVVTLPDAAVQSLVQNPAVEFVQKVISGIADIGTATAPERKNAADRVRAEREQKRQARPTERQHDD